MVGRRQQHLRAVGQDHGLEHVHGLRDRGHLDAVGVLVEDVEVRRRGDGVANGVLLHEEAGV